MATLGLKEIGKFLWEGREYGGKRNEHWIDHELLPVFLNYEIAFRTLGRYQTAQNIFIEITKKACK